MSGLVLDTHVLAWTLYQSELIPDRVRGVIGSMPTLGGTVRISAISFYEIGQKVRLGKWPNIEPYFADLDDTVHAQGAEICVVTATISRRAAGLDWAHRDPFDRLIAATALSFGAPLVSADKKFDDLNALPDWPGRLW